MSKTKTSMNFFALTYLAWGLSEIFLAVFTRSGKSDRKGADQQSQLIIWIAIIASITLSVFVARRFPCAIFPEERMAVAGIIVLCLGILLRFIAIRQLGRFFTVDVTIREDHQLMERGFYKYVRHPSYTGALLSFAGYGLSTDNWYAFFIVFLPVLYTFLVRIRIEEKVLLEQFGEKYKEYSGRTKRLVPFLY